MHFHLGRVVLPPAAACCLVRIPRLQACRKYQVNGPEVQVGGLEGFKLGVSK